jgi:hypothetical protein
MSGNVLVSLLKTTILSDVMQVVSANDDCSLHFGRDNLPLENSSTNRDITSERALFVHIRILNRSIGGLDTKSDVLDETHGLLAGRPNGTLTSDKDSILLLIRLFVLIALNVFLLDSNHFELQRLGSDEVKKEKRRVETHCNTTPHVTTAKNTNTSTCIILFAVQSSFIGPTFGCRISTVYTGTLC